MSARTRLTPKHRSPRSLLSADRLQRAVVIAATAVITSVLLFGGYYYWDRYVRLGDKSPIELNIEHLEQAIREDPQDPDRRAAFAEYYLGKEMYAEALDQAGQVLSNYPDHNGALLVSGIAYVRLDKPADAVAPLEKFVSLRKDQPMANADTALETAYYFLGECYLKLGRPADALAALDAALVITPTDADALYQAGLAHQALGQPEQALERYHKAVRLVPDFTEAYTAMIESYTALNKPDYAAYARGMQAFSLKDYKTAQTHLEFATQALPDFAPAHLGLGLTYEKTGQLDLALNAVKRAMELDPNDFAAQQAYGRIEAARDSPGS